MRHRHGLRKLNRTSEHRLAMLRNMCVSLLSTKRSRPRCPRPRNCAASSSRSSPWARTDARQQAPGLLRLRDRDVVVKLFGELGPRYETRPGGYTRILKMGFRVGDNAPMAFVELVDRPEPVAADDAKAEVPQGRLTGDRPCARVHERPATPAFRAFVAAPQCAAKEPRRGARAPNQTMTPRSTFAARALPAWLLVVVSLLISLCGHRAAAPKTIPGAREGVSLLRARGRRCATSRCCSRSPRATTCTASASASRRRGHAGRGRHCRRAR